MNLSRITSIMITLPILTSVSAAKSQTLTAGFYSELYYVANFNRPTRATPGSTFTGTNTFRYYDFDDGQISLGLAELTLRGHSGSTDVTVDFDFGSFADANAAASASASATPANEPTRYLGQAVVTSKSSDALSFDFGKFYSPLGFEVVKAKDNFNYSRSVLFAYTIPFWNLGARANYAVSGNTKLSAYVVNGWNNSLDNNRAQSIGASVSTALGEGLPLNLNWIGGPEQTSDESNWRNVFEANLGARALSIDWWLDGVSGEERDAKWYGLALYAKYTMNEKCFLAARVESVTDEKSTMIAKPAGATFTGQTVQSATLTYGHDFSKEVKARAEGRVDSSNEAVFSSDSGAKKSQATFLVGLLLEVL